MYLTLLLFIFRRGTFFTVHCTLRINVTHEHRIHDSGMSGEEFSLVTIIRQTNFQKGSLM